MNLIRLLLCSVLVALTAACSQNAEHNFYQALKNTDEYVWVYGENLDWWGTKGLGVSVPKNLSAVMEQTKKKVTAGRER